MLALVVAKLTLRTVQLTGKSLPDTNVAGTFNAVTVRSDNCGSLLGELVIANSIDIAELLDSFVSPTNSVASVTRNSRTIPSDIVAGIVTF